MGLLRKIGKIANPVRATRKTVRILRGNREELQHAGRLTGRYAPIATSFIPGIGLAESIREGQGLKGLGRTVISIVPAGKLGLMAYDAKRLRDKTARAKGRFRVLRKQALIEGDTIQARLDGYAAPGYRSVGPLYDTIVPPPVINLGPTTPANTAQPGGDLMSFLMPGEPEGTVDKPSPDERGEGGDAREGVNVRLAGAGGAVALFVVGGLVLAAWAAHRRAS